MEAVGISDLDDKKFVCTDESLQKLSEGVILKSTQDKVYDIEDETSSGDEEQPSPDTNLTKQERIERMQKEYISLALNANQDPVSKGFTCKLQATNEENNADGGNLDFSSYRSKPNLATMISQSYDKLSDFEALLAEKENPFEEVSINRVYKRTLVVGGGPNIAEGSVVVYNYSFWTQGNTQPFDSSWLRCNSQIIDLSQDSILPGLHELILSCKQDEVCEALFRPEAAFGHLGVSPRIQPDATIYCLLQVVKTISRDRLDSIAYNPSKFQEGGVTFEDLYGVADEARKRGNHYNLKGQYRVALQRYKSGIRILEGLTFKDESEEKQANALLIKLYNNAARAANKQGEPRLALAFCKQVNLIDDRIPKTYWNKMVAWERKGHIDRALGVCQRAMELFPDPQTRKEFASQLDGLKARLQAEKKEKDDLYRLMGRAIVA